MRRRRFLVGAALAWTLPLAAGHAAESALGIFFPVISVSDRHTDVIRDDSGAGIEFEVGSRRYRVASDILYTTSRQRSRAPGVSARSRRTESLHLHLGGRRVWAPRKPLRLSLGAGPALIHRSERLGAPFHVTRSDTGLGAWVSFQATVGHSRLKGGLESRFFTGRLRLGDDASSIWGLLIGASAIYQF